MPKLTITSPSLPLTHPDATTKFYPAKCQVKCRGEIESAMINNFKLTPVIAAEMQTYFMVKTEVNNLQAKLNSLQQTNPSIVVYKTPFKQINASEGNATILLSIRKARAIHGITNSYILVALESLKKERII